jgi:hypothetical protein
VNEPDAGSTTDPEPSGPIDAPQDLTGCLMSMFRCGGCMAILYIIMFAAIIIAAGLSLLFFR